ncbi:GrpB family protein [Leptolyngbya sp. FACHB-261]|uniref:GrpB family protein n=1 Tax=Leptolyngbya sp. FACHB-261 TaxID=2692806 RepID=UPI0016891468|nr:GrpB family protein [Leptolyngbya sp. FACHB-261]MBD2100884.1 GrpB family protein [Leptolyngbya sp. FACHB-261]
MDEIVIVEYDPRWPAQFEAEKTKIWEALGNEQVVAIEHMGSTAVPGLAAKPIIDLMVGVRSLDAARQGIPHLESLGYIHWHDDPNPERLFLVKGMPPFGKERTHHIHIVEAYGKFWERLLFRDYLRAHPEEAQCYAALKRGLAAHFQTDREGYTEAKNEYIQTIMKRARQEQNIGR